MVSSIATLYKKLRLETHENIGWGKIHLPEIEMHTTAYWVALGPDFDSWRRDELDMALSGAGRAMQTVGSVLLMSDPHDLGMVAQVRSPHAEHPVVYLYDGVPGGVGLARAAVRPARRADRRRAGLVEACSARKAVRLASGRAARATGWASDTRGGLLEDACRRIGANVPGGAA